MIYLYVFLFIFVIYIIRYIYEFISINKTELKLIFNRAASFRSNPFIRQTLLMTTLKFIFRTKFYCLNFWHNKTQFRTHRCHRKFAILRHFTRARCQIVRQNVILFRKNRQKTFEAQTRCLDNFFDKSSTSDSSFSTVSKRNLATRASACNISQTLRLHNSSSAISRYIIWYY